MFNSMTQNNVERGRPLCRAPGLLRVTLAALALLSIVSASSYSNEPTGNTEGEAAQEALPALPSSADVLAQMEKVANWQLPRVEYLDYLTYKRVESSNPKRWVQGAFYAGLTQIAERSRNPVYTQWISYKGPEWQWELGPRLYFADDHLIGQTYIWYYLNHNQDESILAPVRRAFDTILADPPASSLEFVEDRKESGLHSCQDRWCWADALFMAPATWVGLSVATGDPRYAEYAHKEARATVDYLLDEEHDLLYRDSRFKTETGEFGEPLFWARGSGWVFAGLARTMEYIPRSDPEREFYEALFKRMAAKLKTLQKEDGSWAMSLLAAEKMPQPETSGTGFFTYGLAWGINDGLLDAAQYEETVAKGWAVLNRAVHPDGKLGWVQAIGAAPGIVSYDDTQLYGVGAYLLAGSAIYDLLVARERTSVQKVMAFGRFVPERQDDFAWENDKVAFRVYGPAAPLEGHSSGVDAWFKRVDYAIVNKWYQGHLDGISYHVDHGEGYDAYHTGVSRGVGGSAIWIDGKAYAAHTFTDFEVIESGGEQVVFELLYEWRTPIGHITENKTVSLELGSQLYEVESEFMLDGKPAPVPVAIGLTTQDEKARATQNKQTGRISTWETLDDFGLGTGALVDPALVKEIRHTPSDVKDESHIWIITESDDTGRLSYRAGFAWEADGEIVTPEAWHEYLDTRAR